MQIHTDRLLLRPIQKQDAAAVFDYRCDALTNQYQSWIPETVDDVDDFIKNRVCPLANCPGTWHQLVIEKKDDSIILGDIGIHFVDQESQQVELGITLGKKYQGKGFATEAMSAVIDFLFTELNKHRITTSIDPQNTNSVNLVRRLGFRQEAHFREGILMNGIWVDDLVFALLRNEWMENQSK